MTDQARTKAFEALIATHTAGQLIEVLCNHDVARDRSTIDDVRARSDGARQNGNADQAELLAEIADALEELHHTIEAFAGVASFDDFRPLLSRDHYFVGFQDFDDLALAFAEDSRRAGNAATADGVERALRVYSEITETIERTRTLFSHTSDRAATLAAHPEICHPVVVEWIAAQARLHTAQDERSASQLMRWADALSTLCRVAQLQVTGPGAKPGHVAFRRWLTNAESERWFMHLPEEFGEPLVARARAVAEGRLTVPDVLSAIGGASVVPTVAAAQVEFLLRVPRPTHVPALLAAYRRIAETPHETAEQQATSILHYVTAVAVWWRAAENPDPLLRDAFALTAQHAARVDDSRSPRLLRDLRFAEGRLLQDLAIWDPPLHDDAARAFKEGLRVAAVQYEREPRGRALSDLANSVYNVKGRGTKAVTRQAERYFREALVCLPADEFPLSRAVALQSYAAFLNERSDGDSAAFQERALALLDEAISVLEELAHSPEATEVMFTPLAGAYLTKGNVLLERVAGDETGAAARDAFFAGIRWAQRAANAHVEGILRLNLANAWLHYFLDSNDEAHAANAERSYMAAQELLAPYPVESARAVVGYATAKGVLGTTTPAELSSALDQALAAASRLDEWPTARDRAYAHHACGNLLRMRGRTTSSVADLERAAAEFLAAAELDRNSGSRDGAAHSSRSAANALIHVFKLTNSSAALERAERVLSDAAQDVDELWALEDGLDWRARVSVSFGPIYSELAWAQAVLGRPRPQVYRAACLAKNRGLLAEATLVASTHSLPAHADALDQLRREVRRAESELWAAAHNAAPSPHTIIEALDRFEASKSRAALRRSLAGWQPLTLDADSAASHVLQFSRSHPDHLVLDLTVTRYGTVLLAFGKGEVDDIHVTPLTTSDVQDRLLGTEGDPGWFPTYRAYLEADPTTRAERHATWAKATAKLLELLGAALAPVFSRGVSKDTRLLIVPGQLAGLPLHGSAIGTEATPVFDLVYSYAYVPNLLALPAGPLAWRRPHQATCILADPILPVGQLTRAVPELADVVQRLALSGTEVSCVIGVKDIRGADVPGVEGIRAQPRAVILNDGPTRAVFVSQLQASDHVFFTGHGSASGRLSGLVLLSESGGQDLMSFDDMLAMPALTRRPVVVLSACETSHEALPLISEMFSAASALLRVGAACVVGHAWAVRDVDAEIFSRAFYEALTQEPDPVSATTAALRALRRNATHLPEDATRWATIMPVLGAHWTD
jgi:hypothetical protein